MRRRERIIEGDRYGAEIPAKRLSVDYSAWLIVVAALWLATSVWLVMVKVELTELQETATILHHNYAQLIDAEYAQLIDAEENP